MPISICLRPCHMSSETDKVLFKRNNKGCLGSMEIIKPGFLVSRTALLHHSVLKTAVWDLTVPI